MRNLMVISLAIFTSAAWSQQPATIQPTGWPQILFWTVNPYILQPQPWAQPTAMPRLGVSPTVPFPTPFWLWPLPPQPLSLPLPLSSASMPATFSPPTSALQEEANQPDASPKISQADHEATSSAEATLIPPEKTDVSIKNPEQPPEETSQAMIPIEVSRANSAIDTPLSPAPPDKNIAQTEAVPDTGNEVNTLRKARTAKKKASKRVRKLCWKNGVLDVCP